MTADRDLTRLVRSWLRDDDGDSADAIVDVVLDRLDTTPQHRSWWPVRRSLMPTYAKLVAAAAALVVVAVLGYNLLPGTQFGGTPTPAPSASPASTLPAFPTDDAGESGLAAGTYVTGAPFLARVSATVPAGWHGHVPGPYYADIYPTGASGGIYVVIPTKVAVEPCDHPKGFVDVGPTVDDLVVALRNMPGMAVTNITTTSISGFQGTALVATAPAVSATCTLPTDGFTIWQNPLGGESPGFSGGESIRVWILDVAGQRLVIALQDSAYSAAEKAATQGVFDSIRIEPAN
jgi:hypothetical protein